MHKKILKVLRSRFGTQSPLVLTHLITSKCNARCSICDLWKNNANAPEDMTISEIKAMLKKAQNVGIICYTVWGGEPLLREDLTEILKFSNQETKMSNGIITNGALLEERIRDLAPYTDYVLVSIDAMDEKHDNWRQIPNLTSRIFAGVDAAKKTKTKIILNTVITNQNLNEITPLCNYAKEMDVLITFEPMEIIAGFNENLRVTKEEMADAFSRIKDFKKKGYPIVSSYYFLDSMIKEKNFRCHAPKIYVVVEPDGRLRTCHGKFWGNVKTDDLKRIFSSPEYKQHCRESESCMTCDVSCNIEFSLLYEGKPAMIYNFLKNA